MTIGVSGYGSNPFGITSGGNSTSSVSGASADGASATGTSGTSGASGGNDLIGKGTWNTQTIKDAGLEIPSKYFIGLYKKDAYRFNPDTISKDFPGQSIQTLADLKKAIDAKKADDSKNKIGTGSFSSENIQQAGIDLQKYGEYFIGVYTNYYRFNPETIQRDFPGKTIKSLSDLKAAIDELESSKQAATTKKTEKNSKGGETVYEYNADGILVKSTEYDSAGRITHEYTLLDDNVHSDKYYTYEGGNLIQTQETLHYPDGNYTYIFKDGNGNLKEEQKVIHNELGGLTFDITFGDGSRHVHVDGADDKRISSTYYKPNGEIEKTEEYSYDAQNPNLYTVTTKNSDGKVISQEQSESYSYIDENGTQWFGTRLLQRIEYDNNGNISKVTNFGNDLPDTAKTSTTDSSVKITYENGNIKHLLIKDANGNVLIDADINDDAAIEAQLKKAGNEDLANVVAGYKEIAAAQENVEKLIQGGDSEAAAKMQAELDKQKDALTKFLTIILNCEAKTQDINNALLELTPPIRPDKQDFVDPKTGKFDELAYDNAMKEYHNATSEYEEEMAKLQKQLNALNSQSVKAKLNINRIRNEASIISNQAGILSNIKEQIANTKDPELKAELEKNYEEIKQIFENRRTIADIMKENYKEIENLEIPTPPSKLDFRDPDTGIFDELAYAMAFDNYEKARQEYNEKQNELNLKTKLYAEQDIKLEMKAQGILAQNNLIAEYSDALSHLKDCINNATDPDVKAAYQKEYDDMKALYEQAKDIQAKAHETFMQILEMQIPTPPSKLDFVYPGENGEKIFDELAYDNAIKQYNKNIEEYKQEQAKLQQKMKIYQDSGNNTALKKVSVENNTRLTNEFSGALNRLQGNIDSASDPSEKAELQAKYDELKQTMKQALELSQKADDAIIAINDLEVPVPPVKIDFSYINDEGERVFDELAYNSAMQKYEQDVASYEQKVAEQKDKAAAYNEQLSQLLDKAGINFIKGEALEMEAEILKVEAEAQRINQERMAISNTMANLYEQSAIMERPVPPSKLDFTDTIYEGIASDGSRITVKKDENGNYTVMRTNKGPVVAASGKADVRDLTTIPLKQAEKNFADNADFNNALNALKNSFPNLSQSELAEQFKVIVNNDGSFSFCRVDDLYDGDKNVLVYGTCIGEYDEKLDDCRIVYDRNGNVVSVELEDGQKISLNANIIIDELAYNNAMAKYEDHQRAYDNAQDDLNKRQLMYQRQDRLLDMKLQNASYQHDLLNQYNDILKYVAQKVTGDISPEKAAQLKNIYNQISNLIHQDLALNNEVQQLLSEAHSLEEPIPPSKLDFAYPGENGEKIFDELAYDNAMNQYDIEKSLYDISMNQINAQVKEISEKRKTVEEQIYKLKAQADEIN